MPSRTTSPRSAADRYELAAVRYLARQERTEAQVAACLSRAGASAARIRSLLSRFREQGYLNDDAYAARWARARLARCPMGQARLEAELLAKGFERATVAKAMRQAYGDTTQRTLARALLMQRLGRAAAGDCRRGASLLRRYGFDENVVEELFGVSESL
ncbi:MAG: RecX family transcriptional regulator [Nitrospirota bacterium]